MYFRVGSQISNGPSVSYSASWGLRLIDEHCAGLLIPALRGLRLKELLAPVFRILDSGDWWVGMETGRESETTRQQP